MVVAQTCLHWIDRRIARDVSDFPKVDQPVADDNHHRRFADWDGCNGRNLVLFDPQVVPRGVSADPAGGFFP